MILDVTQTITKDDLIQDPCPYFCIHNALPAEIYDQLSAQYPESHMMQDQKINFQARRYCQHEFVAGTVSSLWQEFIDYHNSREYKNRVLDLFEPALERYYKAWKKLLRDADVAPRYSDKPDTIKMEVQFVLNGLQQETVRTPHLDNTRELFAGLLYMRKAEDRSTGGDIHVFRKLVTHPTFTGIREVDASQVEPAGSVPYRANTMILFLNTVDTIHGVTPRLGANCVRRYVNIDAHQDRKLFLL